MTRRRFLSSESGASAVEFALLVEGEPRLSGALAPAVGARDLRGGLRRCGIMIWYVSLKNSFSKLINHQFCYCGHSTY